MHKEFYDSLIHIESQAEETCYCVEDNTFCRVCFAKQCLNDLDELIRNFGERMEEDFPPKKV